MDLFSQLNTVSLPGIDDPGYIGKLSSICHLADKWFHYPDYTYRMAELADAKHWEYIITQYRETRRPVSNEDMTEHLKQAIRFIYRHG